MTGPEHYREAERILTATITYLRDNLTNDKSIEDAALMLSQHGHHLAAAQAHATLALAAAVGGLDGYGQTLGRTHADTDAWRTVTAGSPVETGETRG